MPEPAATTIDEQVREIIAEELELFDVLVVTDAEELCVHHEAGRMPNARLVVVDDPSAPLTDADKLVLESARAGKAVRTWCSLTEDGRRIARETAQTLDPHLPGAARVLHITDPPPHAWRPLVDPFMDLVNGARATLPAATKKPARRDRSRGAPRRFETDPESIARRIILTFGAELLIVAPPVHDRKGFSTGLVLDDCGIWCADGDIWARWLVKISDSMRAEAVEALSDDKALSHTLSLISRIKSPKMIEPTQQMLAAALAVLREKGEPCLDVTTCRAEELDAKMRYLGAKNGVIDLHTGELLPREQAKSHLVTLKCPVEYRPGATHPALDKLFAAWPSVLIAWWKGVLGYALRGLPKRLYFAVGPPDSGKSTLGTALSKVLGRYIRTAAPDVLQKRTRSSETQLTPGLRVWHRPTRIVWINEVKETAVNERLTKDLAGGGDRLSARGLHEDLVEEDVTATTFATCNPESIPHLKLTDSGMRSRYRELRYPKATTLDPQLKPTLCDDPGAQRALLAWIVAAAVASPVEPDDVPEVHAATTERIRKDAGEIGEFAQRIVRGDGVLTVPQVWQAWCAHNGEKVQATEPGGIGKRRLSGALYDHIPDLPKPQQISVGGTNVRGWRGWRIIDEETAQQIREFNEGYAYIKSTLFPADAFPDNERFDTSDLPLPDDEGPWPDWLSLLRSEEEILREQAIANWARLFPDKPCPGTYIPSPADLKAWLPKCSHETLGEYLRAARTLMPKISKPQIIPLIAVDLVYQVFGILTRAGIEDPLKRTVDSHPARIVIGAWQADLVTSKRCLIEATEQPDSPPSHASLVSLPENGG